jgi:hypothetical protein
MVTTLVSKGRGHYFWIFTLSNDRLYLLSIDTDFQRLGNTIVAREDDPVIIIS